MDVLCRVYFLKNLKPRCLKLMWLLCFVLSFGLLVKLCPKFLHYFQAGVLIYFALNVADVIDI